MMQHESNPSVLTIGDYIDDFTIFLAAFAGWGVVVIIIFSLLVMLLRPIVLHIKSNRVQEVTTELFIGLTMLIGRNIASVYVFHRPDIPQPYRIVFWLICLALFWRYAYFALWSTWVRPVLVGIWRFLIKPRVCRSRRGFEGRCNALDHHSGHSDSGAGWRRMGLSAVRIRIGVAAGDHPDRRRDLAPNERYSVLMDDVRAAIAITFASVAIVVGVAMVVVGVDEPDMAPIRTSLLATPIDIVPISGTFATPTPMAPVTGFVPIRLSERELQAWAWVNPCARPLGNDWRCYVAHYPQACSSQHCR
jgi:hypothetical protein